METKTLQVKSQNQKDVILKILEDDNSTTYYTFEDYDNGKDTCAAHEAHESLAHG